MKSITRYAQHLLLLLLLAASSDIARSQSLDRLRNYRFDSTLHIGSHAFSLAKLAKDTIGFDFNYAYHVDAFGLANIMRLDSATLNNPTNWKLKKERDYWEQADSIGFRSIFTPVRWRVLKSWSGSRRIGAHDNYVDLHPNMQQGFSFVTVNAGDSIWRDLLFGNARALQIPATLPATDYLIVDRPKFTSGGFRLPESPLYADSATMYSRDGTIDHRLDIDSMHMLRIGFHILAEDIEELGDSTILAYAIMFRRVDTLQGLTFGCEICNIYEPFDTFRITKGMYNSLANVTLTDLGSALAFKDIGYWIDMEGGNGKPTGRIRYDDTTWFHARIGSWFGWPDSGCGNYCDSLASVLVAANRAFPGTFNSDTVAEESDITFQFYTTRKVPITLARTRISQHAFEVLRTGRLDAWLEEELDTLLSSPALAVVRNRIAKFGIGDEPTWDYIPTTALLSQKMQDMIDERIPGDKRGLFENPLGNFDAYRTGIGDLDSTNIKRAHTIARQAYNVISGPIPVHFANPDSMQSDWALARFYASRDTIIVDSIFTSRDTTISGIKVTVHDTLIHDTAFNRLIAFNTADHYNQYTASTQARFGKFRDYNTSVTEHQGPLVPMLARLIDVARFKYRHVSRDTSDVWNVVQQAGWFPEAPDRSGGYKGIWHDNLRIATVPEIYAQSWLSLQCFAQGVEFQEGLWDGNNFGFADYRYGSSSREYGTAVPSQDWDTTVWRLPHMWLGFGSRFEAVKRITAEFRKLDSIVYSKLDYRQEQVSLHDTDRQKASSLPMLAAVRTEKALPTAQVDSAFDSPRYDPPDSAFMEITHFRAGPRDTIHAGRNARYLMFTNRRTWPTSYRSYGSRAQQYGAAANDFGRIDTRRPVIVLKNSTGVIADFMIVEKVGDETATRDTVEVGDTVRLCWLEPGWGALYRITPLPIGVSNGGTAYNNAVHSENPSTNDSSFDRIVVYERDSIVYLRTNDSSGVWSREWMISEADDTTQRSGSYSGWQRRASNFHPAVAMPRTGTSCMVTWERWDHDSSKASVEALWIEDRPRASKTGIGDSMRIRVTPLRARTHWKDTLGLAPAIVGIDGGFVIAFGSGSEYGMSVFVMKDQPYGLLSGPSDDTTSAHNICWNCRDTPGPPVIDSCSYFPTLAYVHKPTSAPVGDHWHWCGTGSAPTTGLIDVVHLAYQQGRLHLANAQHIMYNRIGVKFRPNQAAAIWVSPTEHVSVQLPGCGFLHPSIAVDEVFTGVAFQSHSWNSRRVTLRFRDTLNPLKIKWLTPAYSWKDKSGHWYEWPSVTQFPALPKAKLRRSTGSAHGGLTWFRTNAPGNVAEQYFYKYGNLVVDRIANGQYPTMTLVAFNDTLPFEKSSILYRADTSKKFSAARWRATTGQYYPSYLMNTPTTPSDLFVTTTQTDVIHAVDLREIKERNCETLTRDSDIRFGLVSSPFATAAGVAATEAHTPGLPPIFFEDPVEDRMRIELLDDASKVARTSIFLSAGLAVPVRRHVSRSSNILSWLDTAPYDSALDSPANVWVYTELVRESDSTVLWRGDTIDIRSMASDTLEEIVEVPVHTAAPPGTSVFIRMRADTTAGLEYEMSASFDWTERSSGVASKFVAPRALTTSDEASTTLSGRVTPNPLRSGGKLRVRSLAIGTLTIECYDVHGRHVASLPSVRIERPGEYEVEFDLSGVLRGFHVFRLAIDRNSAVVPFTLVP